MEFRWLTHEERRARSVESSSLSEVLALAQKLQTDSEGSVAEEQVMEMGRELGVRPEYVREALRLRRGATPSAERLPPGPALAERHNPIAAAAQALGLTGAVLLLPLVLHSFTRSPHDPVWILFAFAAALIGGWSARYPRLAGITGAAAVPMVLIIARLYPVWVDGHYGPHHLGRALLFYSLLSLCPLCAVAGRAAAQVRRWLEECLADRERLVTTRS